MKSIILKPSNVGHFLWMKKSIGIVGHTVDHITFVVGSIVIDEEGLALSEPFVEFSD